MNCVLHLSDPHFGTELPAARSALLRLAHQLQPLAIIVSGDLTQRATPAQFQAAVQFVDALPWAPRLVIPGNHDLPLFNPWQRLLRPYGRYRDHFGDVRAPELDLGTLRIVTADTTRAWRHRRGTLGAAQVEQVAQRLAAAPPGCWRIVVTHHPLVVADPADDAHRPRGHAQALARWQAAGCELLLSGHLHRAGVLQVGPGCWSVQAGTSLSARRPADQAPSVNVLLQRLQGPSPQRAVHRYDFDARAAAFVHAGCTALPAVSVPARYPADSWDMPWPDAGGGPGRRSPEARALAA